MKHGRARVTAVVGLGSDPGMSKIICPRGGRPAGYDRTDQLGLGGHEDWGRESGTGSAVQRLDGAG